MKMVVVVSIVLTVVLTACGNRASSEVEQMRLAEQALDAGEFRQGIIHLKTVLQANPTSMRARWLLGQAYIEFENGPAAEKELERALELGVQRSSVAPLLSRAYLLRKDYDKVLSVSLDGLSGSGLALVLADQAIALGQQRNFDGADAKLGAALAAEPGLSYVKTAEGAVRLLQGRADDALQSASQAVRLDPNAGTAWRLLGDVEQQRRNWEGALAAYMKSVELNRNNATDLLSRALVKVPLKQYEGALADAKAFRDAFSDHPTAYYVEGLVEFAEKRFPQAAERFTKAAVSGTRFYWESVFYLASVYLIQENYEQAASYVDSFIGAHPLSIPGRKLYAILKMHERRYDDVVRVLAPVVEAAPDDLQAVNMLGTALVKLGKTDEGVRVLARTVDKDASSGEGYLKLGGGYLLADNTAEAITHLDKAVELAPDLVQADVALILHYLDKKEFNNASMVVKKLKERNPDSALPHNMEGLVYREQGDADSAIVAFTRAKAIAPGDVLANHRLAEIYLGKRDFDAARVCYRDVLEHSPDNLKTLVNLAALEMMAGREAESVRLLERAIKVHPDAVRPRAILARYLVLKGEYPRVIELLAPVTGNDSSDADALSILGRAQLETGAVESAHSSLRRSLELDPRSVESRFLMAQILGRMGDVKETERYLKATIAADPEHFEARLAYARLLVTRGELDTALSELEVLRKRTADHPDVLLAESEIYARKGNIPEAVAMSKAAYEAVRTSRTVLVYSEILDAAGSVEEAMTVKREWLQVSADDSLVRASLADQLLRLGNIAAAVVEFKKVLEVDPNNAGVLNNLAWSLKDSAPGEAMDYAARALVVAPDSPALLDTAAMVMLAKGESERALRTIDRALEKAPPGFGSLRYHKALILKSMGKSAEALQELRTAVGEKPSPEHLAEINALQKDMGFGN